MSQFTHEPLDLSKKTIRLLRLRKSRADTIVCDLRHAPLGEDHVCLSYMWGTDAPSHKIYVDGKALKVRENLFQFLQIAKRLGIDDWLWIDAICIDQDNTIERNHQVQSMGEIYQQAKHVLVYPKLPRLPTFPSKSLRREETLLRRRPTLGLLVQSKSTLLAPDTQSAVNESKRLAYWERLWIVQELVLAKLLYVVTESEVMPWKRFEHVYSDYHYLTAAKVKPSVWDLCHVGPQDQNRNLEQLIVMFRDSKCEDSRDHVYGLIGLARPTPSLSVDYRIEKSALFIGVLKDAKQRIEGISVAEISQILQGIAHALGIELTYYCSSCTESAAAVPIIRHHTMPELRGLPLMPDGLHAGELSFGEANFERVPASITTLYTLTNAAKSVLSDSRDYLCNECGRYSSSYRLHLHDDFILTDLKTFDSSGRLPPMISFTGLGSHAHDMRRNYDIWHTSMWQSSPVSRP